MTGPYCKRPIQGSKYAVFVNINPIFMCVKSNKGDKNQDDFLRGNNFHRQLRCKKRNTRAFRAVER